MIVRGEAPPRPRHPPAYLRLLQTLRRIMPGEIAEMMLDGTLCQSCGEVIVDYHKESQGFPGFCAGCRPDDDEDELYCVPVETKGEKRRRIALAMEPRCCLMCGKKTTSAEGVAQHMRDVHRATFTWSRIDDGKSDNPPGSAERSVANPIEKI